MLNQFRSIAGGFAAKVLLAFLVLTFAVWGIGDMVRGPGRNVTVATVGDASIFLAEYQRALRRQADALRQMLGGNYSPEALKSLGLEEQVLRGLINNALLAQESKALKLHPGDADIVRRIRSNPNFQDKKGNFDKMIFEASVHNAGLSEKSYIENVRKDVAADLIMDTITARLPASDMAVQTLYQAREERLQVNIYTLDAMQVGHVPTPDDTALEAYYAEHAAEFNAPEIRTVSYVVLDPEKVHAGIQVSEANLLAAYKERIDEFKRPERRNVDQLLYADEQAAKKAYDLLVSGTSLAQIAKTTDILNKGAIALGNVEQHAVLETAADKVFSLKAGEVTPPVQSPFGWHIFRVNAIEPPSAAPLEDVRGMLEKELKLQAMSDAQNKLANDLEDMLAGGGTLQEAAKELGLKVHTVGPMTRDGNMPDGRPVKLPDLDKFLETAFGTDDKTESPLMYAKDGAYYILRVDSMTPNRQRTLDEVRGLATTAWQKQERAKRLAELAKDIAAKMADKDARATVLRQHPLKRAYTGTIKRSDQEVEKLALPAMLVSEAFMQASGGSTQAYLMPSGEYALAVVGNRIAPSKADDRTLDAIRSGLERDVRQELTAQYMIYLSQKYPVSVNESVLQSASEE